MISAPVDRASDSKRVVSKGAGFDGVNRDSFFQRLSNEALSGANVPGGVLCIAKGLKP